MQPVRPTHHSTHHTTMLRSEHPHLTALVRFAAVAAIAGLAIAGCGANGDSGPPLSPAAEAGREIMRTNGCAACHGRNGEGGPGPAFVGLYGSTRELEDGRTVVADEDYLFEAIRDPNAKVVEGYGFPMPGNNLSDEQIESVIVYIRELAATDEGDG